MHLTNQVSSLKQCKSSSILKCTVSPNHQFKEQRQSSDNILFCDFNDKTKKKSLVTARDVPCLLGWSTPVLFWGTHCPVRRRQQDSLPLTLRGGPRPSIFLIGHYRLADHARPGLSGCIARPTSRLVFSCLTHPNGLRGGAGPTPYPSLLVREENVKFRIVIRCSTVLNCIESHSRPQTS